MIAAEPITTAEAAQLEKRRRLSKAERAQLERHRIAAAWGLEEAPPSRELLEADRDGLNRRARFGWLVRDRDGRQLAARADLATAARMRSASGRHWAPDLCRETLGQPLALADALGLSRWLERSGWFSPEDGQLLELQALATAYGAPLAQVLGITPGKRATTTLRALLRLAGYRLEAKRQRAGQGRDASAGYVYRVVAEALPEGADRQQLQRAWRQELTAAAEGVCTKNPYTEIRGNNPPVMNQHRHTTPAPVHG